VQRARERSGRGEAALSEDIRKLVAVARSLLWVARPGEFHYMLRNTCTLRSEKCVAPSAGA